MQLATSSNKKVDPPLPVPSPGTPTRESTTVTISPPLGAAASGGGSGGSGASVAAPSGETCWICLDEHSAEELFQPCSCNTFVHRSCLNTWRYGTVNPRNYRQCPNCLFVYRTRYVAVDGVNVAELQKRFKVEYRKEIGMLWTKMLLVAGLVLALTATLLYLCDTSEKNMPVASKYCLQSVINGFESTANATDQWRRDFKRPDVRVWPYYVSFGLFLDSLALLLFFMFAGCTFDETEHRHRVGSCNRFWDGCCEGCCRGNCYCYDPCPGGGCNCDCCDSGPGHCNCSGCNCSGNDCKGGGGDLGAVLIVLLVIIVAIVIFSAVVVAIGYAIRKMNVLYDRYAQRVLDHCKESVGELVVIGRDETAEGLVEGSFGRASSSVFDSSNQPSKPAMD